MNELYEKVEKTLLKNGCKEQHHYFRYGYLWKGKSFYDYGLCFTLHMKKNLESKEAYFIVEEEFVSGNNDETICNNFVQILKQYLSGSDLEVENVEIEPLRGRCDEVKVKFK